MGVMGAVAVAMWRLVARGRLGIPAAVVVAALAAVTALTKVNVGGFLLGAMTLGLVTSLRGSPWRNPLVRSPCGVGVGRGAWPHVPRPVSN